MDYLTTFQLLFLLTCAGVTGFLLLNALLDVYGPKSFRTDRLQPK
ncbi:hypothetical protein SAMN05216227_1003154 [Pseudorhodobacter antarcticus]|uniref:Uncharacterized protein n=1 Tax=Pseudorhodobacter antarcticus TaxID=1077947 RepID=A0A1H8BUL9_9RHOB|nr:hypothetical protein SAMN05216227_1003154 [Pseudorhodobacter antarcticus]